MAPTEQEEMTYYALKHHSLKDSERDELWRKMNEWEKHNQIKKIPFGKSGEHDEQAKPKTPKPNEIDITVQRFGNLTGVRRCATRDMASFWIFNCDCGYQGTFERKKVMDGSRSCCDACKKKNEKPKPRTPDITGLRFGQLTVMHRAEQTLKSGTQWVCKCDCGSVLKNRYFDLVNGRLKRCWRCRLKEEKSKRSRKYEAENAKRAQNKAQRANNKRVLEAVQSGDTVQSDCAPT